MGYLKDMYGKKSDTFIKGVLTGILFYPYFIHMDHLVGEEEKTRAALKNAIEDLSECPEDYDIDLIIQRGYV